MSRWAMVRKARLKKLLPPTLDPKDALTVRVAHRICAIVYGGEHGCVCARNGRNQCCDNPKSAAQHAMDEILK
jgi:hypothetical protein